MFHVKQFNFVCYANKKIKLPTTNDRSRYLPIITSNTLTSLGLTPGMRLA